MLSSKNCDPKIDVIFCIHRTKVLLPKADLKLPQGQVTLIQSTKKKPKKVRESFTPFSIIIKSGIPKRKRGVNRHNPKFYC
jgi:hypothetical protein